MMSIQCKWIPSTVVHYNHIHVVYKHSHCMINIKFKGDVSWKQERLIWIAYYKNKENEKCLLKRLPKAIVLICTLNVDVHQE